MTSFTFALALAVGVACQIAARHLRVPSIVLLLGAGLALGPDFLGLIDPRVLGAGLLPLVEIAVAIILFEGGLNLDLARLAREATPVRRLVTLGAGVTLAGGALASALLLGWPWPLAALFGSLVIVTGPTVVRPLLRNVPLRPRLATILEAEGLLIDPVGAVVAAVALQLVVTPGAESLAAGALGLLARLAFGVGAGVAIGFALARLLRLPRAVPEGLENLVALGGALLGFELCEAVLSESGILAVTVAGVLVGNFEKRLARELGEFQEHLTVGLIGLLFVLLAADVRLAEVAALGAAGLGVVLALALVVRPLGVALCTAGAGLTWRERAFLSWVGPRGVVAAAIASLAAAVLGELGGSDGDAGAEIRALVFLTIAVTVVVQGGSAKWVARWLGVGSGRDRIVILGAEGLGFALADTLRGAARRIVFVDSNPGHCLNAEALGFQVVNGDVFSEPVLARLQLERAQLVIGLCDNAQVNAWFAAEARARFDVPETFVAVARSARGSGERIAKKQQSRVLFDGAKDVARWNVRFRHGQTGLARFEFVGGGGGGDEARDGDGDAVTRAISKSAGASTASPPSTAGDGDAFLLLAVERDGGRWPLAAGDAIAPGTRALAALYSVEQERALAELAQRGWRQVAN